MYYLSVLYLINDEICKKIKIKKIYNILSKKKLSWHSNLWNTSTYYKKVHVLYSDFLEIMQLLYIRIVHTIYNLQIIQNVQVPHPVYLNITYFLLLEEKRKKLATCTKIWIKNFNDTFIFAMMFQKLSYTQITSLCIFQCVGYV